MKSIATTNLRLEFDREIAALAKKFETYPWHDAHVYALWLAQTCYLVQHTPRLLGLIAAKFQPGEQMWHQIALGGLKEEKDHDGYNEEEDSLTHLF